MKSILKFLICSCIIVCTSLFASKNTDLRYACRHGKIGKLENALERGALINSANKEGNTCLHLAAEHNRTQIIKYLRERTQDLGVDFNATNRQDQTPLHTACLMGSSDSVMELFDAGASLEARDSDNRTPLHYAVEGKSIATVLYLAAQGANANAQANGGNTPVHDACESDTFALLKALLWVGPQLTIKNSGGWTALHISAKTGNIQIMTALLDKDAPINAVDTGGWTALHVAAFYNQLKAAELLMSRNAHSIMTKKKELPSAIAQQRGFQKMHKLLKKSGK